MTHVTQRMACAIGVCLALLCASSALAQAGTARVRVLHAAQDGQAVDVLLDGTGVIENQAYAQISDYFDAPAGARTLTIAPAGVGPDAALLSTGLSLAAGGAYTVAAVGPDTLKALTFSDDLSPAPAGKARVRFIHLSPDTPGADVELVDGTRLFERVSFGEASDYLLVDAGTYNLRVVATGSSNVFVQLPATEIEPGMVYDVIATGRLANLASQIVSVPVSRAPAAAPQQMPATSDGSDWGDRRFWLAAALVLLIAGASVRRALAVSCSAASRTA